MKKLLLALIFSLSISGTAFAVTKTVCSSGCDYTTIAGAFSGYDFAGGDILEIRADAPGGSKQYNESIAPGSNDVGTSGNQFIIRGREGDTITIAGQLTLSGRSYITIDNLHVETPSGNWSGDIGGANSSLQYGTIIQNSTLNRGVIIRSCSGCQFLNNTMDMDSTWAGIVVDGHTTYKTTQTRIEGNTITGPFTGTDAISFHVGDDLNSIGDYHIIKNNVVTMTGVGENCYDITDGNYIVLDGNTCSGAAWQNSAIGHTAPYNNISWVRVVNHTSRDPKYSGSEQIYIGGLTYLQIVRSVTYGAGDSNLRFADDSAVGNNNIRIFHNVFDGREINGSFYNARSDSYMSDVKMKNNIFLLDNSIYQAVALYKTALTADYNLYWDIDNSPGSDLWSGTYKTLASIRTNLSQEANGIEADPLFVAADTHDYRITSSSPAHDEGGWLTTITSATEAEGATTFTVADPLWFYDGWNITGETGDVIKTENGQTATITAINYTTGAITVGSAITWTQNEGIGLSYNGTKPDIGYYEVGGTATPTVTISATDAEGAEEGTDPVTFTITCSPVCAGETINFTYGGGAILNTDYNCANDEDVEDGDIAITGATDTITCTPVDDDESETAETITVTLTSGTGYIVGSPFQANATITDNDGAQDAVISGMSGLGVGTGEITYDSSGSGKWTR